jgi:hypothetical protein
VTAIGLLLFTLIAIQFARAIDQNVALASELSSTQHDIDALTARRAHQMRELRRLEDPEGSVPEIHERLRLVGPHETMVFISPAPSARP